MESRRPPTIEKPDLSEKGGAKDGQPQSLDRRLFMQFLAFGGCSDASLLTATLSNATIDGVLYEDVNDPQGVGLLTMGEDPAVFVTRVRQMLNTSPFAHLTPKPEYTMLGRTYSLGYEPDLEETLFRRPRRTALNPAWPWAIWYPLRRSGEFAQLPPEEQRAILGEHGLIGRAFGEADYAHDIRLACHGLDKADNDFIIGVTGKELHPLSALVQRMRGTKQTSLYLERLGPFFVGRAVWKSALNA
jgi:chlorite dismutase